MHFTLVSILQKVLDLPVIEWVTIPTQDGIISVFPSHEALITALIPGMLTVRANGTDSFYAIGGGIAEITPESITITADMAEDGTNFDLETIREKKEESQKLLEEYKNKGESMDMDVYIELEQQFLKESAREQLATR